MPSNNSSFLDIDDDLEGVDDFGNEPNPFDDATVPDSPNMNKPTTGKDGGFYSTMNNKSESAAPLQGQMDPPSYDQVIGENPNENSGRDELRPGLINYYSRYFQLDLTQFKKRLSGVLTFRNDHNNSEDSDNEADLYGAVWITATVVMINFTMNGGLTFIINNVIDGIRNGEDIDRASQFKKLLHSIWLFYGYTFGVPFITMQILKRDEHSERNRQFKSIPELISVYGYANLIWIPICVILNILDMSKRLRTVQAIQWAIVALGWAQSSYFLNSQMLNNNNNDTQESVKSSVSIIVVVTLHALFCLLFRFIIF
ncbi:yip5p [Saccharomyces arboricola H-6]|uniref:Protein YIP n=1 Tax=Saccharomyces arboricola (strain H-6 / AS 2.3317 / CBS 10644) TaxID=1160507 RepID=J8Q8A3_SACAR|nr:yip5p [Saccharomyces arboricola H-6]